MRRKDSTEATVEKVELKTELDALKPIEPKDVIDFDVNDFFNKLFDFLKMKWKY